LQYSISIYTRGPVKTGYVQVRLGSLNERSELAGIFATDVLKRQDSSGLLMHDRAKTSLAFDNDIRYTHLTAQGRKENDEFDGVNIVSYDDERSLLCLDECNNVVQAVLDVKRLLRVLKHHLDIAPKR